MLICPVGRVVITMCTLIDKRHSVGWIFLLGTHPSFLTIFSGLHLNSNLTKTTNLSLRKKTTWSLRSFMINKRKHPTSNWIVFLCFYAKSWLEFPLRCEDGKLRQANDFVSQHQYKKRDPYPVFPQKNTICFWMRIILLLQWDFLLQSLS